MSELASKAPLIKANVEKLLAEDDKGITLDQFLRKALNLAEKAEMTDRIEEALKEGSVATPRSKESPYTYEDTKAIVDIIIQCCFAYWNENHKPIYIHDLSKILANRIQELVNMGMWHRKIPGHRTRERCINYSADKRIYDDGKPKLIAPHPGYYMPNPALFEAEFKEKLLAIYADYTKKPKR